MTQIIQQMYGQPGQPGQQQSPHNGLHQQQGPPPQYRNGPEGQQPMNPAYGPPPGIQPNQLNPNRPEMAPVHPQYHPAYHAAHEMPRLPGLPPTPGSYYGPPPQDYRPAPPPNANTQSAPRQRTAIACKYCRRRKIRCSGFENSEDGRCTNCARFSQQCIFTPVSAQTQAFVPAQAVYGPRGSGGPPPPAGPPQFYGSYGQPLPRQPDGYPPPPQQYGMHSPGYPPPPGQHPYGAPAYPPQPHYEQQPPAGAGRRRTRDEPHTPTLPPPNPGNGSHLATHPGQEHPGYGYPDPGSYTTNGAVSPNSAGSYQTHQPQPYYTSQPPSHNSPAAPYQYEPPRASSSPHGQQGYGYTQPALAPQPGHATGQGSGRTPPPLAGGSDNGSSRNGVAIRDIVSESNGQGERTAADSDMVSALNRTSRR